MGRYYGLPQILGEPRMRDIGRLHLLRRRLGSHLCFHLIVRYRRLEKHDRLSIDHRLHSPREFHWLCRGELVRDLWWARLLPWCFHNRWSSSSGPCLLCRSLIVWHRRVDKDHELSFFGSNLFRARQGEATSTAWEV